MPRTHPERGHQGSVPQSNLPEGVIDRADLDVTHVVVVVVVCDVIVVLSTFLCLQVNKLTSRRSGTDILIMNLI
jgi:hypothetical protein